MKEKLWQFKEFAGNLSSKTKKLIIVLDEDNHYVVNDNATKSSATVTVIMKYDGINYIGEVMNNMDLTNEKFTLYKLGKEKIRSRRRCSYSKISYL